MKKTTLLILSALVAPSMASAQNVPALQLAAADAPIVTSREARRSQPAPIAPAPAPALVEQNAITAAPAAPQGPPPAPMYAPPAVRVIAPQPVKLTARETKAVELSDQWQGNKAMPATGMEGAVVFGFGETLPSIICAPLFVCDVQLQPGELVSDILLGDTVSWKVRPAESGSAGEKTTHLMIKPADAGLTTNLVVTTDRRVYVLKLVSTPKKWMSRVSFSYPDEQRAEWETFMARQRAEAAAVEARAMESRKATVLPTGESIQRLDFGFDVYGDKPAWRPLRVYSDGRKTYIEFPREFRDGEAPALVAIGADNKPETMNYRVDGDRYVVDQVVQRVALILGSGRRQEKVEIARARRG